MTAAVSFREAKKHAAALPPAERDAYIARVIAYRQEADRAGGPFQVIGLLLTFAAIGVLLFARAREEAGWAFFALSLAVFVAGAVLQHLATRRKRAWMRAHPFES